MLLRGRTSVIIGAASEQSLGRPGDARLIPRSLCLRLLRSAQRDRDEAEAGASLLDVA